MFSIGPYFLKYLGFFSPFSLWDVFKVTGWSRPAALSDFAICVRDLKMWLNLESGWEETAPSVTCSFLAFTVVSPCFSFSFKKHTEKTKTKPQPKKGGGKKKAQRNNQNPQAPPPPENILEVLLLSCWLARLWWVEVWLCPLVVFEQNGKQS